MRVAILSSVITILFSSILFGELSIKDQKIANDVVEVYADNPDNFPYTISIDYKLTNCKLKNTSPKKILIPANVKKYPINEITLKRGQSSYSFSFNYWKGNQLNAKHEDDYLYNYPCDEKYKVIQGYHGTYSHKNSKSLDFEMPIGSKVFAARDGVVLQLKEDSNFNCKTSACMNKANFILILHADGSIANYAHLKQNGVIPKIGDKVSKGELIAYSGNTGWSGTPHLHFEVYTEIDNQRKSQETKFILGNGKVVFGKSLK
jgi:murein DD-endopeptidase MepM/ murein hydrolase activator NlpD